MNSDWNTIKLKYGASVNMGQSPDSTLYGSTQNGTPFLQGNSDFTDRYPAPKVWCPQPNKTASKGDILLSVRAPVGAINLADQEYGIGRGLCSITPTNFDPLFLKYYLESSNEALNTLATGSTFTAISTSDVKNINITNPDISVQKDVGNFLDNKVLAITQLLKVNKKLITLFEEKNRAVINQAVTKGLNPSVSMSESGVALLGEIPSSWKLGKLKYVAKISPSNIDKKSYPNEKAVRLCNYLDVYNNDYITNNITFMKATASNEQVVKFILKKGDVLVTKDSESPDDIAIPAYVSEDFEDVVCGYHLTHIRPEGIDGHYLFWIFNTSYAKSYFEIYSSGVTRYAFGVYDIRSFTIPLPPMDEQKSIVKYLHEKTEKINESIKLLKKENNLLNEYKQSLIYHAVTGKIDVNNMKLN